MEELPRRPGRCVEPTRRSLIARRELRDGAKTAQPAQPPLCNVSRTSTPAGRPVAGHRPLQVSLQVLEDSHDRRAASLLQVAKDNQRASRQARPDFEMPMKIGDAPECDRRTGGMSATRVSGHCIDRAFASQQGNQMRQPPISDDSRRKCTPLPQSSVRAQKDKNRLADSRAQGSCAHVMIDSLFGK